MPLFVLRIADGGAADMDGRLRVGDQILEINGCPTDNMTHTEAIEIIQNGGTSVRLLMRRTNKPPPVFGKFLEKYIVSRGLVCFFKIIFASVIMKLSHITLSALL